MTAQPLDLFDVQARLLDLLASGPHSAPELAALAGLSANRVRLALQALRAREYVLNENRRWRLDRPAHATWPRLDLVLHGFHHAGPRAGHSPKHDHDH